MAKNDNKPTIYELTPSHSIAEAVSKAQSHVSAVEKAAGNAQSSGSAGATIVMKGGKGKGNDK